MERKKAIIIGAGPAGLTAAYELLKHTNIKPIVLESSDAIGGISKTVNYKGHRIDIGGHRFFSKSDLIMDWWEVILPKQGKPSRDDLILKREIPLSSQPDAPDPEKTDKVMLIRSRLSRIYFLRKFFDYPISLKFQIFYNLGLIRVVKIILSYFYICLFPIREEKSLEDFFINRFGKELYLTFFKDYTEKVWGVPCYKIKPEWGAQRIKGLSISKTILHAIKSILSNRKSIYQKNIETSLIGQFLYPKYGPGQLWEEVAIKLKSKGGKILLNHQVVKLYRDSDKIDKVLVKQTKTGEYIEFSGDYFISTMPIKELVLDLTPSPPEVVQNIAKNLVYRDFITVGLLLTKLKIKGKGTINNLIPDNWIYIQERDVKLGRIQIFNNWSPYLVLDNNKIWLGLEYFSNEGDELWSKSNDELARFAISELKQIDFIEDENDVLDYVIIKTPKAYPAYFGSYDKFNIIREFLDKIENLFLIGRNGMHRYNNQDHSMLTAIEAVKNISNNITIKGNIWSINTEIDYHEHKSADS